MNRIFNNIINTMNKRYPNLNELEKARYLYIQLGKILSYDINVSSLYDTKAADAYYKAISRNDFTYSCRQISILYADLLRKAGINARAEERTEKNEYDITPHMYTVIELKDGRKSICDLTFDLPHIKKKFRTTHFGIKGDREDTVNLDADELFEADKKIGYTLKLKNGKEGYMNEHITELKEDLLDEKNIVEFLRNGNNKPGHVTEDDLIRYKFHIIGNKFRFRFMKFWEGNQVLLYLYKEIFTPKEKDRITLAFLETEGVNGRSVGKTVRKMYYTFKEQEGQKHYYLYEDKTDLTEVDEGTIKSLKKEKYDIRYSKKYEQEK